MSQSISFSITKVKPDWWQVKIMTLYNNTIIDVQKSFRQPLPGRGQDDPVYSETWIPFLDVQNLSGYLLITLSNDRIFCYCWRLLLSQSPYFCYNPFK